ncbi:MAG: hypothetical protein ACRYFK_18160 [Janthinobacterium lividum]
MNGWGFVPDPPFTLMGIADDEVTRIAWEHLKQELPLGAPLSGRIFARTHFGVFYDAGVGFPIRINVTDFGKPEGGLVFPDDYPALASIISGEVSGFEDRSGGRQQIVTVRNYKDWRSSGNSID